MVAEILSLTGLVPTTLASTGNGTYTAVVAAQTVTITGKPIAGSGYSWATTGVVTTVTPTNITSTVPQ